MSDKKEAAPTLLGKRIRDLRKSRGLTLEDLARRIGTSAPTLHRYEGGWDRFELNTLRRIAAALGATLEIRLVDDEKRLAPRPRSSKELILLLAPLFWDHVLKETDLARHPEWVLARVLMSGDKEQVTATRARFGDEAVRRATQRREVDARTRNYWRLVLQEGNDAPESPRA